MLVSVMLSMRNSTKEDVRRGVVRNSKQHPSTKPVHIYGKKNLMNEEILPSIIKVKSGTADLQNASKHSKQHC